MKISFILVCLFALFFTVGCAQDVVYRINPDAPPKMKLKEARDAVELSLTLRNLNREIENVSLDIAGLSTRVSPGGVAFVRIVGYADIDWEIIKEGKDYVVPIGITTGSQYFPYRYSMLIWKSEEDAKLFLDAFYALRQFKVKGAKDTDVVASAPAPPLKKVIPPQESTRKEKPEPVKSAFTDVGSLKIPPPKVAVKEEPKKIEPTTTAIAPTKVTPEPAKPVKSEETPPKVISTVPELAQAKSAPSASPPYVAPEIPKPAVPENIPPKITITTPDISHTVSVAAKKTDITITGLAESNAGLIDVLVNSRQADLSEQGHFSAIVPLKVGQNKITVTAIDVFKNKATRQFAVNREAGKTAVMKAESVPPKITITAPDTTRTVSVVAKKMDTLVTGIAESEAGIMYVSVNGQDADLDDKGNFSAVVPLKVGQNKVTVIAGDINKNKSTKEFVINREAGKVMVAKKEEDKMTEKLSNSKYYALLIAVQNYDSPEISKLDYPVSDAKRLEDLLLSQYTFDRENIISLVNPTRRTIYQTLQSLRNKLTDQDNLLIFYAGHGFWVEDMKQGFWLAKDASGINDPSDWIPNSTVRDYIKAIKARHILLVADSCFSGGIFKTRELLAKQKGYVDQIYELPSRRAMTSGAMKTVPDQSVFLNYLVKRLKDNNEPYLDAQKLFANMREAVINNSPTHQTPLYGAISEAGDEGGDFIFVRR